MLALKKVRRVLLISLLLSICVAEDVSGTIAVQSAMKFNGGGHINHSIFWKNLTPNGGGEPTGTCVHMYVHIHTCAHTLVHYIFQKNRNS